MKWFSYSANGFGFELHDTEEAAREAAQKDFDTVFYDDSFPEEPQIEAVWGRVHGLARRTHVIETPDGEADYLEEWEMRSPDEPIEVIRKRRWTDEHGDEQEEAIEAKGGE